MKNISFFLSENFIFLVVKFSGYLYRHVFVMISSCLGMSVKIFLKLDKVPSGARIPPYNPNQSYSHFLKSTKYVALTLEKAVVCYML